MHYSSPEREVLRAKCSDHAVSIACLASSVSTFYLVYALEAIFSVRYSWNLVRMFATIKSQTSLKLGHLGRKTRSQGQILEKPCLHSIGHILSPILMALGQKVCLDQISDIMGHVGSKTRSLSLMFVNLVYTLETTFLARYSIIMARVFPFMKSLTTFKLGWKLGH